MMHAEVGDWLVVPPGPHEAHGRRGLVVAVAHPDGTPPYRVRWLDDEHMSLVFPPLDSRVEQPVTAGGGEGRARR